MKTAALEVEQILDAPVSSVWAALTNNDQLKKWYFDLAEFKPEIGFDFQFYGSKDDRRYLHLCKVTAVIPEKKIAYSWKYENHPGETEVSFELFEQEGKTRLKLSHTGIESFGTENPDLSRASFEQGWTYILGTSLKNFIENSSNQV
ncbi:SRPBCC domain-containing protein [Pedobacter gandavensis]|uniref:SRPBCC family protein n=1 Tax=Pedobacter gandavensis TaxID=2679963 RepID=UPI002931947F|nr:SRPBCC domain-containing protein [Pedobacter gandavensis]